MEENEKDRDDISIEGSTGSWDISLNGDHGLYTGNFKFRCFLTPMQALSAAREHRKLLGENATLASQHHDDLAYSLTQLKYRVISAPPFWTSTAESGGMAGDLPDENVIMAVLDAAIGAELKYRKQLKKKTVDALDKAKKAAERLLKQQDENEEESQETD